MTANAQKDSKRMVGVTEAAIELGLSAETVRRYIEDGKIPAVRLDRKILIARSTIEKLINGSAAEQRSGRRDGLAVARAMAEDGSATHHPAYEKAREQGIIEGLSRWGKLHGAAIAAERARTAEAERSNPYGQSPGRDSRGINDRDSRFHRRFPHLKSEHT